MTAGHAVTRRSARTNAEERESAPIDDGRRACGARASSWGPQGNDGVLSPGPTLPALEHSFGRTLASDSRKPQVARRLPEFRHSGELEARRTKNSGSGSLVAGVPVPGERRISLWPRRQG